MTRILSTELLLGSEVCLGLSAQIWLHKLSRSLMVCQYHKNGKECNKHKLETDRKVRINAWKLCCVTLVATSSYFTE